MFGNGVHYIGERAICSDDLSNAKSSSPKPDPKSHQIHNRGPTPGIPISGINRSYPKSRLPLSSKCLSSLWAHISPAFFRIIQLLLQFSQTNLLFLKFCTSQTSTRGAQGLNRMSPRLPDVKCGVDP
ncbi:hypothetical protein CC2G_015316 [Coprinopsis cinerea AmutBmut pab1-1]|nr:hypothetical protein CC2G_015316 [Coprinopsis cinerea AmutBmut pab1-1]